MNEVYSDPGGCSCQVSPAGGAQWAALCLTGGESKEKEAKKKNLVPGGSLLSDQDAG